MKFIKFLFILCILSIILNACSTLKESGRVLRNEKTKTTDEFLIKKKEPLTQPPDFETIPEPGSTESEVGEQNSIAKILKTSQTQSGISQSKYSSTEEFILNQIKK